MRAAHALSQSTALIASTPGVAALFRPVGWRGDDVQQQCTLETRKRKQKARRPNAPPVDDGATAGNSRILAGGPACDISFQPAFCVQALLWLDAPSTATEWRDRWLSAVEW